MVQAIQAAAVDLVTVEFQARFEKYDAAIQKVAARFDDAMSRMLGTSARIGSLIAGNLVAAVVVPQVIEAATAAFKRLHEAAQIKIEDPDAVKTQINEIEKAIEDLAKSYGTTMSGFRSITAVTSEELESTLLAKMREFEAEAERLRQSLVFRTKLDVSDLDERALIEPITALVKSFKAGEIAVSELRSQLAALQEANPSSRAVAALNASITEQAGAATLAEKAVQLLQRRIADLGRETDGTALRVAEWRKALEDLATIAPRPVTDRDRAKELYDQGVAAARGLSELKAVETDYYSALDRIGAKEKAIADERAKQEAARKARHVGRSREAEIKEYEKLLKDQEIANRKLAEETALVGQSQYAADLRLATLRLTEEAMRRNIALTEEERGRIAAVSAEYARRNEELRRTQQLQQDIASIQQAFGDLAINSIEGLADGTQKLNDVLQNSLKLLLRMTLQAALLGQGPLAGIFGTRSPISGGMGGLFGGAFANGGAYAGGEPILVGERGPELMLPGRAGSVVKNSGEPILVGERGPEIITPDRAGSIVKNSDLHQSSRMRAIDDYANGGELITSDRAGSTRHDRPQSSRMRAIDAFANGGAYTGGEPILVGERGPELMLPGRAGSVVKNSDLTGRREGGGGNTIVLNNDFRDSAAVAVAAISNRIDRLERSLPSIITNVQTQARQNNPFYGS